MTEKEILEASIKKLETKVSKYSANITAILNDAMKNANSSAKYWRTVNKKLTLEYGKLSKVYREWAKVNVPKAYKLQVKQLMTELNKQRSIARKAKKTFSQVSISGASSVGTRTLYLNAVADWEASLMAGKTNLLKLTRRTRQNLLLEEKINATIYESIASGNLMKNANLRIKSSLANTLNELADIIDGEKYVVAGSRKYRPSYYAEMVTRGKFHEAQAFGATQVAKNYGTSLVQVSSHNTKTPICIPYEDKIYSIDGKDKRFPTLYETPPFHVNCLHNLFPVFVEAMEVDGTLKGWEQFSKGKTEKPPINSSYVPASLRTGI